MNNEDTEDPNIYTLGTLIAGSSKAYEDATTGYNPTVY